MKKAAVMSLCLALLLNGAAAAEESLIDETLQSVKSEALRLTEEVKEEFRHLTGLDKAAPGTMAILNGRSISLRQIEALYDMRTAGGDQSQAQTLDELHYAYAACLRSLIIQQLVHEELEKRHRGVTAEELHIAEERFRSSYGLTPEQSLDSVIQEEGIDPLMWREQLRSTLEQRRLQNVLAESFRPSHDELEQYITAHPELLKEEERCRYLSVSGADRRQLDKVREEGVIDAEALKKLGLRVEEVQDWTEDMPPSLQNALADIKVGECLPVQAGGSEWGYVILLEREQARSRAALDLYAEAQKELRREALPRLYDEWLDSAVTSSSIQMVPQLQPHNIPRVVPRSYPDYTRLRDSVQPDTSLPED